MTYFFVNTYQTLFQCLALYTSTDDSIVYVSDQCVDHSSIVSILNDNGIRCLIDKQYKASTKIGRLSVSFKKSILYNFFTLRKPDEPIDVYINGSISSWERLKYVAICRDIYYLDGGYQHYRQEFLGFKNFFYSYVSDQKLALMFRKLFGFRLNFKDKKVTAIIYSNQILAKNSDCVQAVRHIGKYREEFTLLDSLTNEAYKKKIICDLFPGFSFLKKSADRRKKTICLLTQPFYEDGHFSLSKNIDIYRTYLSNLDITEAVVYLKIHPRESNIKYDKLVEEFDVRVLVGNYPFELFEMNKIDFDVGVTFNSTAVFSNSFKKIVTLAPESDHS